MPPIARRFLFSAATTLVAGVALGFWLLLRRELRGAWPSPYLVSAHVHLVMVGTVLQVICGVALWMFPRPLRRDAPEPPWAAHAAWWLLTPGTLLRAAGEAARGAWAASGLAGVVVTGALMQAVGLALVLVALRHRLRPARQVGAAPL